MKPNDINTILPHLFMRIIIKQKDRIKKCGPLKDKIFFATFFVILFDLNFFARPFYGRNATVL